MSSLVSVFKVLTGVGLTVAAVVLFEHYVAKHNWKYQTYSLVGEVTQINISPVSLTKGSTPQEAMCTAHGISFMKIYDREFFIARAQGPDFAKTSPTGCMKEFYHERILDMEAIFDFRTISFSSPSGSSFQFDFAEAEAHSKATEQMFRASSIVTASQLGKKVAKWLKTEIGQEVKLYRQRETVLPRLNRSHMSICSICSEESVRYVKERLKLPSNVKASYFRFNIIIAGCKALEEKWWSHVRIGDVYFQVKDPDLRVVSLNDTVFFMPTLEELNKPKHFTTSENYGQSFPLGVNALVIQEGVIKVGDPVFASKYYGIAQANDAGSE